MGTLGWRRSAGPRGPSDAARVIGLGSPRPGRGAVDRGADRLVAATSIVLAVAFLVAAAVSLFLPAAQRLGVWLPLHLAMAGAASVAIAGVMPFFSAAFATAQPVDARLRWSSIVAVAVGAALLSTGFVAGLVWLAVLGGITYSVGIMLTAISTFAPLAGGLGPRGGVVALGYGAALVMVGLGALLASLFLAGWPPVAGAWASLKPAHAWLNLVGFVSLVIATTLLHFFPTVIGARMKRTRSAQTTIVGLAVGAAAVAAGFALPWDLLARLGAVAALVGASALALYAWDVWRTRARWTGDPGWHRFAMGGLISAIGWFELGLAIAAGRVLLLGIEPTATRSDPLVAPLVAGWAGLAVLASATHLVPSVGPGGPVAHARQRETLGRGASARLLAANAGVAALALGVTLGLDALSAAGGVLMSLSLAGTALLVIAAIAGGIRDGRRQSIRS